MIGDYGLDLTSKTSEDRLHIIGDAVATEFDDSLLPRPQLGKLEGRVVSM